MSGAPQVFVLDVAGRRVRQLTSVGRNEDPTWAPDGRHIAFVSDRSGPRQLWVIDIVTGRIRQLTFIGPGATSRVVPPLGWTRSQHQLRPPEVLMRTPFRLLLVVRGCDRPRRLRQQEGRPSSPRRNPRRSRPPTPPAPAPDAGPGTAARRRRARAIRAAAAAAHRPRQLLTEVRDDDPLRLRPVPTSGPTIAPLLDRKAAILQRQHRAPAPDQRPRRRARLGRVQPGARQPPRRRGQDAIWPTRESMAAASRSSPSARSARSTQGTMRTSWFQNRRAEFEVTAGGNQPRACP